MTKEIRKHIDLMIDNKLATDEFIVLLLVMQKDFKALAKFVDYHFIIKAQYEAIIKELQKKGWLKIVGDDYLSELEIRAQFTELFTDGVVEKRVEEVGEWIQKFRDIFRRGKSGKMGDPNACLEKMKKFVRTYPQFTVEQILTATARYVDSCGPTYNYLQQADYFISKESVDRTKTSRLLSFLEDLSINEDEGQGFSQQI